MKGAIQNWLQDTSTPPLRKASPLSDWAEEPRHGAHKLVDQYGQAGRALARAIIKSLLAYRLQTTPKLVAANAECIRLAQQAATKADANESIQLIYDFCLDQLEAQQYSRITELLRRLDVSRLAVAVMLAPLSITVPVATQIPGRSDYYNRVAGELTRRGRRDVAELLSGLD